MNKNYRIKDIAEMAGVSTGTVDRILHNRGKVSPEAQERVEKVLKEIDYHPNLIARSLALKKVYNFYILIPSFKEGEYWSKFCEGVRKAEDEYASYNVTLHYLFFDQYDKSSFDLLVDQLREADCQGVAIATLFKDSVLGLTVELDKQEIPYVLVDSYIEGTNCLAYYGTHSYKSGYIAGRLMGVNIVRNEDVALFRFIRKGEQMSTQVQMRERGFRDYLVEHDYKGTVYPILIHADNPVENKQIIDTFLTEHPTVKHGIIFNSRVYLLAKYFNECKKGQSFRLIGYDLIDNNLEYLNSDIVTHLIAQRPEVQGLNCVKALFRYLVLGEQPEKVNYMPIDILIKENIPFYNNYI